MEIFGEIQDADPLDLLWDQIRFSYTAILRAQRIAYVKDAEDRIVQALSLPMPLNDKRWSRDALNSRDKSPLQSLSMEDAISMALASRVPLFIRIARSSVLLKLSAPCATSLSRGLSLAHKSFIFIVQVYWGYSANSQSRVAWVQSRTFTLTKSPALCELSFARSNAIFSSRIV